MLLCFTILYYPQRNQFQWNSKLGINHSAGAIMANAWTAYDFVNEARRNRPGMVDGKKFFSPQKKQIKRRNRKEKHTDDLGLFFDMCSFLLSFLFPTNFIQVLFNTSSCFPPYLVQKERRLRINDFFPSKFKCTYITYKYIHAYIYIHMIYIYIYTYFYL